jgi:TDG/mug DNA glycosylase family protein
VAFLGMGAYRVGFRRPKATLGEQPERIAASRVWLLPNPSGRTAAYQMDAIVAELARLRQAASSAGSSAMIGSRRDVRR